VFSAVAICSDEPEKTLFDWQMQEAAVWGEEAPEVPCALDLSSGFLRSPLGYSATSQSLNGFVLNGEGRAPSLDNVSRIAAKRL